MQKINITGIRSKVIMNRLGANFLMMEELSEKDNDVLDTAAEYDKEISILVDNKYIVRGRDIFLYGEVDLNNKEDLELLMNTDIMTDEVNNASNIPSDFNYETGDVYKDKDGIYKCHDTWNKLDWFKFNHCLLGKPKRIIIYRINKQYVPRNRSTIRRNNDC